MPAGSASGEGLLVIYAGLSPSQRRAARDGGILLDIGQLGPKGKQAAAALLTQVVGRRYTDYHDRIGLLGEQLTDWQEARSRLDLRGAKLKLRVVKLDTLFLRGQQSAQIPVQPTSIVNQARLAAYREKYPEFPDDPVVFLPTVETGILASIVTATDDVFIDSYFAPSIFADSMFGPLTSLPASFLDIYKREFEEEKRRLGGG
jgi:hypothetical protein